MKTLRSVVALLCVFCLTISPMASGGDPFPEDSLPAAALVNTSIPCKSAILIDGQSGKTLFEKDSDIQMPPASITKIMSLLLVMEAIDKGKLTFEDAVTCSPHASSMGGSQIWLEVGEEMTVHELLKAAATASANDAIVALGEHIAGSEEAFVHLMNQRGAELGMKNTTFINATGLDAPGHLSTARDIAIMSAELLRHPQIIRYTTIWMDSLRGGATELVNTNKLVRFYKGTTGLKTGTTDGAGSCLAASATRDGLSLIAVVLGSPTSDNRFGAARGLLDYGFANYEVKPTPMPEPTIDPIPVRGGTKEYAGVQSKAPETVLVEKGEQGKFTQQQEILPRLTAPVAEGEKVGSIRILKNGVVVCEYELVTAEAVERMTLKTAIGMLFSELWDMG